MATYPYYQQPIMMNPYQQTPVQPYQDRLAQLQNNYQQTIPYGQIQQPVQQIPQMPVLQGQMVDGIDTVKAKDVDMSGNPVYYPKTDGTEIYRKQLQADGRSKIFVYRLENPEQQGTQESASQVDIASMINQLRSDICTEISEIKNLLPTQMSATNEPSKQNGGKQR